MRRHYAVMWTDDKGVACWCRASSKRVAVRYARDVRGTVYSVGHGANMAWDAPTFRHVGDLVVDYSREASNVQA